MPRPNLGVSNVFQPTWSVEKCLTSRMFPLINSRGDIGAEITVVDARLNHASRIQRLRFEAMRRTGVCLFFHRLASRRTPCTPCKWPHPDRAFPSKRRSLAATLKAVRLLLSDRLQMSVYCLSSRRRLRREVRAG